MKSVLLALALCAQAAAYRVGTGSHDMTGPAAQVNFSKYGLSTVPVFTYLLMSAVLFAAAFISSHHTAAPYGATYWGFLVQCCVEG